MQRADGTYSHGTFEAPTVADSNLPALLGLRALRQRRCVIDLNTLKLHVCGPADYDLTQALPPGRDTYQGVLAPSGHLMLKSGEFRGLDRSEDGNLDIGPNLALPVMKNEATGVGASSSSTSRD